MINEVTVNSNNTIELSRGQLLTWVNDLLKTNLTKIEQLGTGAVYCQLTDALYPGRVPMAKVNWKVKYDYQFVNNFKILQQTFTKVGILKHVQVEKLVKCKYQDNLQMLQWFKKIFDSHGTKDYNPVQRRQQGKRDRQNNPRHNSSMMLKQTSQLNPSNANSSNALTNSNKHNLDNSHKNILEVNLNDKSAIASFQLSDRCPDQNELRLPFSAIKNSNITKSHLQQSPQNSFRVLDSPWKDQVKERAFNQQRQLYLRKFKQMEHLMQEWNTERSSAQLIQSIRRIMLVVPGVQWQIKQGEYVQKSSTNDVENHNECALREISK